MILNILRVWIVLPGIPLPGIKVEARVETSKDFKICQVVEQTFLFNETRRISCQPGLKGSIVRIASTGSEVKVLSLCEVQVYGGHGNMLMFRNF